MVTKQYGHEVNWSFGGCYNTRPYRSDETREQECCQEAGTYDLWCLDSYQDGWNGGYLVIEGKEYCKDFKGHKATRRLAMGNDCIILN